MRKLILKMSMSLDGFVGGPNGEMDWVAPSSDEESRKWSLATVESAGIHALGRKTWETLSAFYPTATIPFAPAMNAIPKIVFTRAGIRVTDTPGESDIVRSWTHPRVATGDLATEIAALKREPGKDIVAHAGAEFARALIRLDLVDEYRLAVHPVVLGTGLPLFSETARRDLELVESRSFAQGAVGNVYRPAR